MGPKGRRRPVHRGGPLDIPRWSHSTNRGSLAWPTVRSTQAGRRPSVADDSFARGLRICSIRGVLRVSVVDVADLIHQRPISAVRKAYPL